MPKPIPKTTPGADVPQPCFNEMRTEISPEVDSARTNPTPLAYHFFSLPRSSFDQSFVRTHPANVLKGTVTVSPKAAI